LNTILKTEKTCCPINRSIIVRSFDHSFIIVIYSIKKEIHVNTAITYVNNEHRQKEEEKHKLGSNSTPKKQQFGMSNLSQRWQITVNKALKSNSKRVN